MLHKLHSKVDFFISLLLYICLLPKGRRGRRRRWSSWDGKVVKEERENHDESARLAMEVVKEEKEGDEEKEEGVLANLICFVAQA